MNAMRFTRKNTEMIYQMICKMLHIKKLMLDNYFIRPTTYDAITLRNDILLDVPPMLQNLYIKNPQHYSLRTITIETYARYVKMNASDVKRILVKHLLQKLTSGWPLACNDNIINPVSSIEEFFIQYDLCQCI